MQVVPSMRIGYSKSAGPHLSTAQSYLRIDAGILCEQRHEAFPEDLSLLQAAESKSLTSAAGRVLHLAVQEERP
jgi:hypothetical protein